MSNAIARKPFIGQPCEYAQNAYGVPAFVGQHVLMAGRPGTIAADRGHYIGVNFDDAKPGDIVNVHPDDLEYTNETRRLRKPSRSRARYLHYLEVADCFENFKDYLRSKA